MNSNMIRIGKIGNNVHMAKISAYMVLAEFNTEVQLTTEGRPGEVDA